MLLWFGGGGGGGGLCIIINLLTVKKKRCLVCATVSHSFVTHLFRKIGTQRQVSEHL